MLAYFAKRTYVGAIRSLRLIFRSLGLLVWLERRSNHRIALWVRSLFAIYDIEDLIRIDLPWWTLDAVQLVERFLSARPKARVFEYGSGASTIWLSKRCGELHSVEHDSEWLEQVRRHASAINNLSLHEAPAELISASATIPSEKLGWEGFDFSSYVNKIAVIGGKFDLIVIDGRARIDCLKKAVIHLAEDGVILFDNSNRKRYRSAILHSDLKQLKTTGLTSCLPFPDATTFLAYDRSVISNSLEAT